MSGRVAIISLRFNPAFLQHLIAYAKAANELGMEARFVLDPVYRQFGELAAVAPILDWAEARSAGGWSHAIFFNVAGENGKVARELKARGAKIYYLYHEPWQISLEYLRNEGLRDTVKAALAHRMTVAVLKIAEKVIVESECGLRMYRRADARINANAVFFPQIYDDDAPGPLPDLLAQKRYFSFIGNPCRAHGFEQYLQVMRVALQAGGEMRFLIASRHALPEAVVNDPVVRRYESRIELRCGKPLSNDEMNRCYAESFCVWNLYRRSTQSGVLPKAYMFGAPVIASRIGSFPEFVQEGFNGRFGDSDHPEEVLEAVEAIRSDLGMYAANCRQSFLQVFYYRSRLDDLRRVLS